MRLFSVIKKHPYITTVIVSLLYLIIFQFRFVFSGDIWAEAFYEYVYGAVISGWEGFFKTGIAGYFNFLPKLLSYPYVIEGLPLQHIDTFFRLTVIAFTIACTSFLAHPYNRHLIKSDLLRSLLSIALLLTFYHVSSFSFINVWYVGFIPIILVSLHPKKFPNQYYEVLYAVFAMAICLTKPSLIVLPLVLYRTLRHKEILLGSIIIFAIALQSALFFSSSYYAYAITHVISHTPLLSKVVNTLLYPGLIFLKLLKLYPFHLLIVIVATAVIGALTWFTAKTRGWIQMSLLIFTLLLASYTAIYPPDTYPFSVINSPQAAYLDEMKLQRELVIAFILVLLIGFALQFYISKSNKRTYGRSLAISCVAVLIVIGIAYRPIDTQSSRVYVSIDSFRPSLKARQKICMPIPPTPSWTPTDYVSGPTYGWYYESNGLGTCTKYNYEKSIDFNSFTQSIGNSRTITVKGGGDESIKTILILISNPHPGSGATLELKNEATKKVYNARIASKSIEDRLNYVAFNLTDEPHQSEYVYTISQMGNSHSDLRLGSFKEGGVAYFSYFMKK